MTVQTNVPQIFTRSILLLKPVSATEARVEHAVVLQDLHILEDGLDIVDQVVQVLV